ncbi:MAG: DUF4349 domain-containing protein [Oscillospiraceae bacterium]|nr:DUF4349 domain-containing protein [Oscillospiraceae bacterium]MBQ7130252.1 DUF4349 domain-containing protein [Oscillospiraceae bacterium]
MKKLTAILLTLCLLLGLTACGGSAKSEAAMPEEAMEAPAAMATASNGTYAMGAGGTRGGSTALPEGRKWIITIDMNVETDDLDVLMESLDRHIKTLGGYVEDQNVHNGSNYASRRYRNANLTVRIPDENVDKFTEAVSGIGNVVSQNLRREDITLKYVSTSSRVTALETEQARLLELLAKAETMEDLLEIEARLTDVRYELENYASQLRLYDNQIDYATIYLYIDEVQEYTPVEEPTFVERITKGFTDSLKGLGEGTVDVIVWLISASPYLVVFGTIGTVTFLIVRRIKKKKAAKKAASEDNRAE